MAREQACWPLRVGHSKLLLGWSKTHPGWGPKSHTPTGPTHSSGWGFPAVPPATMELPHPGHRTHQAHPPLVAPPQTAAPPATTATQGSP